MLKTFPLGVIKILTWRSGQREAEDEQFEDKGENVVMFREEILD